MCIALPRCPFFIRLLSLRKTRLPFTQIILLFRAVAVQQCKKCHGRPTAELNQFYTPSTTHPVWPPFTGRNRTSFIFLLITRRSNFAELSLFLFIATSKYHSSSLPLEMRGQYRDPFIMNIVIPRPVLGCCYAVDNRTSLFDRFLSASRDLI